MVLEYDWELHRDLLAMRERYGNHRRFYKSAAWRRLRAKVLEEFRYESQDELHASPARYVRATCVHHDRFVDKYPGWALSEWWVDDKGNVHCSQRGFDSLKVAAAILTEIIEDDRCILRDLLIAYPLQIVFFRKFSLSRNKGIKTSSQVFHVNFINGRFL